MKKTSYFKTALLFVTLVTPVLLITSCTNNQKKEDTKAVAEEHNDAKFIDNKLEKDAQFLVNAAEINLEQIKLGKLAQQIGRTAYVKDLGIKMDVAHTKLQSDLSELAKSKMISIPTTATDNANDAYKKLNEKSGKDFDQAYADMMVNSHKEAVSVFEKASVNSTNDDIKNWATVSLPDLRANLDKAIDCQKKCSAK